MANSPTSEVNVSKVKKTKVGSEYRAGDKKTGKLHGEFNREFAAMKRAEKS